ncbi:OmpA family protein [Bernardetia sp.]|uniref:OmpA family protein n=1 Tax=Bernardetia sp. TaxID=1937974 RepID=UPI0025BCDFEC|nr:OmpA family protein [Bernardetia sp.]
MSPHLEEIEKIEQLLESENFNIYKLNDFSETEKQDILLQKQLVEELTNLQILEELDEIHQQRTSNNFRKKVAGFALFLVLLLSSIGFYLINDVDNTEQTFEEKVAQENIESNQKAENNDTNIFENTISKPLQSGLSWRKNTVLDSLEQNVNLVDLEKSKIRRIHIIDTTQENFFHNRYYATNYSLTTSTVSNEIIVSVDNKFFYLHPVSYHFTDSLYKARKKSIKNHLVSFWDYHIVGSQIKVVNPDGKNSIATPSLSADGNTLYYSKKNKKGDYDIWKTERILENGKPTWQEPTEVTALNKIKSYELSPTISADGKTIYFSRKPNATGCGRIYFSTKNEQGEWTEPKMIPVSDNKHINYGCDVAPYILPDGNTLLFSAQRTGNGVKNLGLYDIYLTQKQENGKWSEMELIESISSDSTESNFTVLPKENKIYFSRTPPNGGYYFQYGRTIPIPKQLEKYFSRENKEKLIAQKNKLIETSTGKDFELEDFIFASNSALLTQKGKENLERIVLFMNENKMLSLQIVAHTDNEGKTNYNQILSEKRAKSVSQFLEGKGIEKTRLIPIGKGESQPKVENTTLENKAKNRRVEFFVIESTD